MRSRSRRTATAWCITFRWAGSSRWTTASISTTPRARSPTRGRPSRRGRTEMPGTLSQRLDNTTDENRGQPLAFRVLAGKDELEDALCELSPHEVLERQAIETALATVYALMTGDL